MLAAAARACACQAPAALLRRSALANHAPLRRRLASVTKGASGHVTAAHDYTLVEYSYTHNDLELLARRAPHLDEHVRLCEEAVSATGELKSLPLATC